MVEIKKMTNNYKVAVVMISLNTPYWQYVKPCIDSLKKFFLKGHSIDFLLWSDMPKDYDSGATKVIPTESFDWPIPTLMRYHLFLREEKLLEEYDYILYCDADMRAVSRIGDEVLGDLVAAQHPMYAIRKDYIPPYEGYSKSTSYIPRVGRVVEEKGKKRFQPLYLAGGFQGGRSDIFINAMKEMKKMVDTDFTENNHIPIWNDESVWNAYLLKNPPTVVLNPSYIYPDSLVRPYYMKVWGRNFVPKLMTITKKFSMNKEGGQNLNQVLNNI